ncbi:MULTISPECIES: carbohydrate porin [Caldimonas]|uniref:maltoporin n=1 Tax=Caldimonas TaxID=196013 RepID=UPI00036051AB|nr:carbohydrate porin [Caldimonas manganoxidans]
MDKQIRRLAGCLAVVAAAGWAASPSWALDSHGYFRAGPGATKKDAARACYGLQGPGLKYRLGNECDFYGEFFFSENFKAGDVDTKIQFTPNLYNAGTDTNDAKLGLAEMFVEGKGFDIAPEASFWVGKRYYARADVHIVDTFFTQQDGVGGGMRGLSAGPGRFSLAYFRTDDGVAGTAGNQPGHRLSAEWYDLPVNAGGKLRWVASYTRGSFSGGQDGLALTAQHQQENFLGLGGSNTLWLQYAQGSANLNTGFGDLSAGSGHKGWRLVESFTWQQGAFGGQALAMWQTERSDTGDKVHSISLGGRASYALTRHFKMVAELGHSQRKPDGGATQKLTKFTLAPTLSTAPGFWTRPELRLYVTTARWNDAANVAAGSGGVTGLGDGKTSGTSFGAQVEVWW